MPYDVYRCPACGDWSDTRDWCDHCNLPMKKDPHVDSFSHSEPDYGSMQYQQYIDSMLEQQAKESNMLMVEVNCVDGHTFTMPIDSVLEVPKKGASIVCGKCGNQSTVLNVGFPYRADSNGQHSHVDTDGQQSLIK